MHDFFSVGFDDTQPWLILGKGPTFSKLREFDTSDYMKLSLNHVVREVSVDVAQIIDFDVLISCKNQVCENARYLAMPYYPHIGFRPHPDKSLSWLTAKLPVLEKLNSEGRLLAFNLSTGPTQVGPSPVIDARSFSAESAVNLISSTGARTIRTLGVDGGIEQAENFGDLANHQSERGYDEQWSGIASSILRSNLDFAPLGVESPIKVFVGASEEQLVPARVLEYSIKRHATMTAEVVPLYSVCRRHRIPRDPRNRPRTPFSFQRFQIPEVCGYDGKAIYMDSDMLVFGDLKELWTLDCDDHELLCMLDDSEDNRSAVYSAFLVDCEKARWDVEEIVRDLDANKLTYESLVFEFQHSRRKKLGLAPTWNSLEQYEAGRTKLLHYTDMARQPWLATTVHPHGDLWFHALEQAVAHGFVAEVLLKDHVRRRLLAERCLSVLGDLDSSTERMG